MSTNEQQSKPSSSSLSSAEKLNNKKGRGSGGGGRGRNRNRSGRGRGGRRRGNNNNNDAKKNNNNNNENNNSKIASNNNEQHDGDNNDMYESILTALEALGHHDPESVCEANKVIETTSIPSTEKQVEDKATTNENNTNNYDDQLYKLTLWLEDRVIRFWSVSERQKLRNDFWSTINEYLYALEIPNEIIMIQTKLNDSSSSSISSASWRFIQHERNAVVYWLLSCAASEAYADQQQQKQQGKPLELAATTTTTSTSKNDNDESRIATNVKNESISTTLLSTKTFPLGFSTGDEQVDQALTLIRMKFLLQLEQDQKIMNDMLAQKIVENSRQQDKKTKPRRK